LVQEEEEVLPSFSCPEYGIDVLPFDSMLTVALGTSLDSWVSAYRLQSLGIAALDIAIVYNSPSRFSTPVPVRVSETS